MSESEPSSRKLWGGAGTIASGLIMSRSRWAVKTLQGGHSVELSPSWGL